MTTDNITQTRKLGNTDIEVSALGIGTWAWGDSFFWDYGKTYGKSQIEEAFKATVAGGVTFFDTAEVYGSGKSEQLLGEFCKATDQKIDIATKYAPLPWRLFGGCVADALTQSLKNLQMDYIPLYQVHWPFMLMSQDNLMNALADEVEKGRIGAIGVSNYSSEEMKRAKDILAKRNIPLAVNQVKYSLVTRKIEAKGILKTAQELGITLLAYSPLAQGLLTGKYNLDNTTKPEGARKMDSRFSSSGLSKIAPVLELLKQLGEKYQKTPAQVSLNWLMAQENVIPIPGAKNAKQAQDNTGALGWSLSSDEVAQLEEITKPWLNS
ncbi:aldo/keto reductase [Cyanobacterium sp. IPPAS B-1200]|uniref:aldo/keto reductase n=1 Tax=Cyanobacterium sp. IPPAS B-1200 TaxID=1562720 RepID=UPI0008526A31|nr:aldo/keto reductase [Cyanobacterium sp. IPPAS B-1200]OEJ79305.1 2,5-didehydrogluconate reductase [Cyanobacterium sp. IPPAS B-1200]